MDHRSGMWRRKPSEKNLGESESSGSVSSYSERYSDEQEVFGSSPTESLLNHAHSLKVPSVNEVNDDHEIFESLTKKLSAARLDVAAKEDLIKQHAKVTEEAISGWETAEAELTALKQKFEASSLKNSFLEDRLNHLEEALKDCVRQLRKSREEREQKAQDALFKTHQWESEKFELEKQIEELYGQLENAKTETFITIDKTISLRLESLERENKSLKSELLAQSEQLRICSLEKELSSQTAELACKQHLDTIKKVAKLESECRWLQAEACRTSKYQKPIPGRFSVEYLADGQLETKKLVPSVYIGQESLDSWTLALNAQLDEFKNAKAWSSSITASTEIELMDDFLEMEKLVATPEADNEISSSNLKGDFNIEFGSKKPLINELEALQIQAAELGKKVENLENEKAELKMILTEFQIKVEASCNELLLTGDKLVNAERKLDLAIKSKEAAMAETFDVEERRKEMESRLDMAHREIMTLREKVDLLQGELDAKKLSAELELKTETLEATRMELQLQLNSAYIQAGELRDQVNLLEGKLGEERALSAMYLTKVEANEVAQKKLEIQLMLADSDLENFYKTVDLLELELKEKSLTSAMLADRAEIAESARRSLEFQLESAHSEAGRLHNEIQHLHETVDKERALSVEYSTKCHFLEEELSKRNKETELLCTSSSNSAIVINKEKELAEAAGKLADCQKTIASLGQQLKSLTNIDEFMFDANKPEKDRCLSYFNLPETKRLHSEGSLEDTFLSFPNGKERGALASPVSVSAFPGFV